MCNSYDSYWVCQSGYMIDRGAVLTDGTLFHNFHYRPPTHIPQFDHSLIKSIIAFKQVDGPNYPNYSQSFDHMDAVINFSMLTFKVH